MAARSLHTRAMAISSFDMFKIGIGPSSSHTVGPMRAAATFAEALLADGTASRVTRVRAQLFGSLGATGHGHGSRPAVLLGLEGSHPETVDTAAAPARTAEITESHRLHLGAPDRPEVDFDPDEDLVLHRTKRLPFHTNGMVFTAFSGDDVLVERTFYSIGGGFVLEDDGSGSPRIALAHTTVPFDFASGAALLEHCRDHRLSIPEVQLANELALGRSEQEVRDGLLHVWDVMDGCIAQGCATSGVLPGGLRVRRRAHRLHRDLLARQARPGAAVDPLAAMDWLSLWALAVNEENASGGRVVTAPTNGAAGIIPSVLKYAVTFLPGADEQTVVDFLLTAGAIGGIYQQSASISGAEVGC